MIGNRKLAPPPGYTHKIQSLFQLSCHVAGIRNETEPILSFRTQTSCFGAWGNRDDELYDRRGHRDWTPEFTWNIFDHFGFFWKSEKDTKLLSSGAYFFARICAHTPTTTRYTGHQESFGKHFFKKCNIAMIWLWHFFFENGKFKMIRASLIRQPMSGTTLTKGRVPVLISRFLSESLGMHFDEKIFCPEIIIRNQVS